MSEFTVTECNGLNGAMSRGLVHAGGRLVSRTGYLDLGRSLIAANAHLWGEGWSDDIMKKTPGQWEEWPLIEKSDVVCATPPCSGFSVMTGKGGPGTGAGAAVMRGVDHPSNNCMWDSVRYAARHAPEIYMFESVTGAFKIGRELMLALRAELERVSGEEYTLTHWLHDGAVLGAPTSRQRYMFVAVKGSSPFAVTPVDEYAVEHFTTVRDAIGDLEDLDIQLGAQPIHHPERGGTWAHDRQRADGLVDGMMHYSGKTWLARTDKVFELGHRYGVPWPPSYGLDRTLRLIYQHGGRDALVEVAGETFADRMVRVDFSMGPYSAKRECWDSMHNLVAGGGTGGHIHPSKDRFVTYREVARIQGWPDELVIDFDISKYGKENIEAVWGKAVGCLVSEHAGQEVADWMSRQTSDKTTGELLGDREWVIDELDHSRRLRRDSSRAKKAALAAAGF